MRTLILAAGAIAAAALTDAQPSRAADAPAAPPAQFFGRWAAPGARCFGRGVDVIEVGADHLSLPDASGPITEVRALGDRDVEIVVRTSPGGGAAVVTRPVRLSLSADGSSLTEGASGVTRKRCDAPTPSAPPPPPKPEAAPTTSRPAAPNPPIPAARVSPYADVGDCMWREIGEGARNKVRDVLAIRVRIDEVVDTYKRQGTYERALAKCDPEHRSHIEFTESLYAAHAIRVVALDYFAGSGVDEAALLGALRASPATRRQLWQWMQAAFDDIDDNIPEVDYGPVTRRLQLDAEATDVAETFYQFDALENFLLYDEISPPGGPITPNWLHRPTSAEIDAAYPAGVGRMSEQPRVTMTCTVGKEGRFAACEIESEQPAGYGFGRAAQQVAKLYRLDPWSREGEPLEDTSIRITITFGDPPRPRPAPPSAGAPPPLVIQTVPREERREYGGPPIVVPAPPAPVQGGSDARARITNPVWVQRPTGAELEQYYPARARDQELNGQAMVQCQVTREGTLTRCVVVSESPAGAGFGEATIAIMQFFRMQATVDGRSVEGAQVRVPVNWRLG
ncbi:MAG: TonB family protein [Caulobacteraceae bacterium]|nr:TonB family protein [Caulobacteraceae bacterium]